MVARFAGALHKNTGPSTSTTMDRKSRSALVSTAITAHQKQPPPKGRLPQFLTSLARAYLVQKVKAVLPAAGGVAKKQGLIPRVQVVAAVPAGTLVTVAAVTANCVLAALIPTNMVAEH